MEESKLPMNSLPNW